MNKKWAYFLAVIFLLVLRFGVLNTEYDALLMKWGYVNAAHFIAVLKENTIFNDFVGSWAMPFFVAGVLLFWTTNSDDEAIPMQFLLLPIAYIPFSIIGAILINARFQLEFLWVHPLIILPFGYFYVSLWTIFIWFCCKIRLLE